MSPFGTGSAGENVTHFNGVRMRVLGSGSLEMTISSLDEITSFELLPFTLAASTNIEPTRLCNFMSQRGQLEVSTSNVIDEWFQIDRLILFAKTVYKSLPM